jgi:hypothetical protein
MDLSLVFGSPGYIAQPYCERFARCSRKSESTHVVPIRLPLKSRKLIAGTGLIQKTLFDEPPVVGPPAAPTTAQNPKRAFSEQYGGYVTWAVIAILVVIGSLSQGKDKSQHNDPKTTLRRFEPKIDSAKILLANETTPTKPRVAQPRLESSSSSLSQTPIDRGSSRVAYSEEPASRRATSSTGSYAPEAPSIPAIGPADYSRYYDPTYRPAVGHHWVAGYYRRDGTYVQSHYRTNPDNSFYNNWSTKGNVNPYTGKAGTKVPPMSTSFRRR